MARNYRKEYDNYQGTAKQKKARARRNAVRRLFERLGKVRKGDGKDVSHKGNRLKLEIPKTNRARGGAKKK